MIIVNTTFVMVSYKTDYCKSFYLNVIVLNLQLFLITFVIHWVYSNYCNSWQLMVVVIDYMMFTCYPSISVVVPDFEIMINSIVVVKLLPKLWSSKLSNRAIAGDILISNFAKSISVTKFSNYGIDYKLDYCCYESLNLNY